MKNRNLVFEIIKKELRDVIRDKKTLIMMIIVPIFLYPLMFGIILTMEDSMLDVDESVYNTIGFAFETDEIMDTVIEELNIQKENGSEEELKEKLNNEELNAYIVKDDNKFMIYYTESDTYGQLTLEMANEFVESYQKVTQYSLLTNKGINPEEIFDIYTVEVEDISDKDAYTEMMLKMVPSFIIMTTTLTAIFAAIDMTAGEKERGTLETLLTFPIKIGDIIKGKFVATSMCTVISSILGFTSMYAVLYFLSGKLETFSGMQMLSLKSIILVLLTFVLYSLLISALSIVVASKAKSFKEAQNSTQPLAFITLIPMFMSMMGTELSKTLSLIPFINVNLMLSDIIAGKINIQYFILMAISSIVFIYIILKAISKLYESDKILFG